jgi:hypothetical protein
MTAEIEAAFAASASIGTLPPRTSYPRAIDPDLTVRYIKSAPHQKVVPSSGIVSFDMDGPKTGYQWTVRRVAVSDAAALSNSMGTAYCGIYAGQPSELLITPSNLEWIMPVLPNVANFSTDQLVLQYGEHLLVQVTGATPGESVICAVAYQLYTPAGAAGRVEV